MRISMEINVILQGIKLYWVKSHRHAISDFFQGRFGEFFFGSGVQKIYSFVRRRVSDTFTEVSRRKLCHLGHARTHRPKLDGKSAYSSTCQKWPNFAPAEKMPIIGFWTLYFPSLANYEACTKKNSKKVAQTMFFFRGSNLEVTRHLPSLRGYSTSFFFISGVQKNATFVCGCVPVKFPEDARSKGAI